MMVRDLKVGVGRFLLGEQAVAQLEKEMRYFGEKALIIGGPSCIALVASRVRLCELGIVVEHTGECSRAWALKYSEMAKREHCSLIIGIGGGKCIDLAKCAATYGDMPIINVPTSVATCVASSAVCIMYTDEGKADGSVAMKREVDVVIADTGLIRTSPGRLWAAGMVDSLAKLPEVIHNLDIDSYHDCDLQKYICNANAQVIWEFIMGEAKKLYDDLEGYDRLEDMILTNLLHTSIVSGFSSGSGQLALAHGLYDFMRREFTKEAHDIMHGEIVGVGLIMQIHYNEDGPKGAEALRSLMAHMGMPLNLKDIHFEDNERNREKLLDYLVEHTLVEQRERLEKALESIRG